MNVYACVQNGEYSLEANFGCLFQSVSTIYLETGSFTEPGTHQFGYYPDRDPCVCYFSQLKLVVCTTVHSCICVCIIQFLMVLCQILSLLRYLPSPNTEFVTCELKELIEQERNSTSQINAQLISRSLSA